MAKNPCVLVIDDEARITNFVKSLLRASGYDVIISGNGIEALEKCKSQEPDIVILDLMMPLMDGVEMLKELRTFSTVPVIILSAKSSDIDKIKGLHMGADDYLPKPFNPDELLARIEALRRRLQFSIRQVLPETYYLSGDIEIDCKSRKVHIGHERRDLTRIEWLLLIELIHNAGRVMTHQELLTRVWGTEYRDDLQILRPWICRLRDKLKYNTTKASLIVTIPKTGYMINQDSIVQKS